LIYLDYNATTPLSPAVIEAMLPFLKEQHGNPSSDHEIGRQAKAAVDNARSQVAALIGASAEEIVFTSGGTESNNLALFGLCRATSGTRDHIITTAVEHPAVLEVCRALCGENAPYFRDSPRLRLTVLGVDADGLVDPNELEAKIDERTLIVSVMHANNEVGTIEPIARLCEIAHRYGALFHCDAAQSIGKLAVDVDELGVDLLSIAGHKLYAPKGIGALYVKRGTPLTPQLYGASQERGLRPGTENVMQIVGLGEACRQLDEIDEIDAETERLAGLRDKLHRGLCQALGESSLRLNGHRQKRLPNTLSLGFLGCRADRLMHALDGKVALSAGAACHSGGDAISSVLRAMQVPDEAARGTLRLSLGHPTTAAEIEAAVPLIAAVVEKERASAR
jgi:cysteine desulfurase